MEPTLLGLVLDASIFIAWQSEQTTLAAALNAIRAAMGDVPVVVSPLTIAELSHGVLRAETEERRAARRKFVDEIKAHVPIHPFTEGTAEIVARVHADQSLKGVIIPLSDLIIGACAIELGYAIATRDVRDFDRIPGPEVITF